MKDLLTIVIPCKNEKNIILKTLDLLNYQTSILDVNVIVCDVSDDTVTDKLLQYRAQNKTDLFNLTIIPGGLPSVARNNGFKLVTTQYVLFLDADIFLLDPEILLSSIIKMRMYNLDLATTKFRSDNGKYNYVYKTFDVIQSLSKWITPFCLGGFMLVRSKTFRELGGFDEEIKVAEDYHLSKQIKSTKFERLNHVIFTPPRRFEAKGVGYMIKLMIGSFFNRRNKKWFIEDKNYWK
jgi:glycosyltransferase involved in cell wall biosynthesis